MPSFSKSLQMINHVSQPGTYKNVASLTNRPTSSEPEPNSPSYVAEQIFLKKHSFGIPLYLSYTDHIMCFTLLWFHDYVLRDSCLTRCVSDVYCYMDLLCSLFLQVSYFLIVCYYSCLALYLFMRFMCYYVVFMCVGAIARLICW